MPSLKITLQTIDYLLTRLDELKRENQDLRALIKDNS
jgi:hypothetical protein